MRFFLGHILLYFSFIYLAFSEKNTLAFNSRKDTRLSCKPGLIHVLKFKIPPKEMILTAFIDSLQPKEGLNFMSLEYTFKKNEEKVFLGTMKSQLKITCLGYFKEFFFDDPFSEGIETRFLQENSSSQNTTDSSTTRSSGSSLPSDWSVLAIMLAVILLNGFFCFICIYLKCCRKKGRVGNNQNISNQDIREKPAEVKKIEMKLKKMQIRFGISDHINVSEDNACFICFEKKKRVIYIPCNHLCSCINCAKIMIEKKSECPLCRIRVHDVMEISERKNSEILPKI